MNRVKGEAGFTLPEMLVVLLVVSCVTSLAAANFKPVQHTMERKLFMNQLKSDLYLGQTSAMANQTNIYIQFYQNSYQMFDVKKRVYIVKRLLPENVQLLSSGTFSAYKIGPDGTVNQFGTIYFQAGGKKIKLVTHIGSGRFYVQE
ncbi:competence type IV pilus minor pilin ComGD [Heyndrickxia acidiproducens]|uniref:competence type IV pilus minor pilin ComGD n=1 Tax=Heyndrickxia acidiproducens TaxID=1121084 RepID=UPI000382B6C1|nr:competence type IV pilus minor pilin ComGD [Heyndrickxia acidiproducens]